MFNIFYDRWQDEQEPWRSKVLHCCSSTAVNNLWQNQIYARILESFKVLMLVEDMQVYYCPNGKCMAILLVK